MTYKIKFEMDGLTEDQAMYMMDSFKSEFETDKPDHITTKYELINNDAPAHEHLKENDDAGQ